MSAFPIHRTLLVAAITSVLALGSIADAAAQTAAERAAERRAARQAAQDGGKGGEATVEYPQATRKEPGLRATARMVPRINKVVSAQQDGDLAAAEAAASGVLENDKANAYER